MVLTDKKIREYVEKYKEHNIEHPLIEGFVEERLQSESYDISITDQIMVPRKEIKCISLEDQNAVDSMYEKKHMENGEYIISPKEYMLVTVSERINLPDCLTAHIRPRTRFTRLGLIVSDQHCNSTYSGNLNLGIFNATEYPIKIKKGMRVAQIVFEELDGVPSEHKLYRNKENAAYQNEKGDRGANFEKEVNDFVDRILAKGE